MSRHSSRRAIKISLRPGQKVLVTAKRRHRRRHHRCW